MSPDERARLRDALVERMPRVSEKTIDSLLDQCCEVSESLEDLQSKVTSERLRRAIGAAETGSAEHQTRVVWRETLCHLIEIAPIAFENEGMEICHLLGLVARAAGITSEQLAETRKRSVQRIESVFGRKK